VEGAQRKPEVAMPDRTRRVRPARSRPEPQPSTLAASSDAGLLSSDEPLPGAVSQNGHTRGSEGLDGWFILAAGILALGFGLRFLSLGGQPLTSDEATSALQSLGVYRGQGAVAIDSPLTVYGQALAFALFGASDATARLIAAVLGTVIVALPFMLERELGRLGSRVSAFLLAISPTLVYMSRQSDAAMPVAALGLLAVVCYHLAARESSSRRLVYAVVAVALLFTGGPLAYYSLVAFGAYFVFRAVLHRSSQREAQAGSGRAALKESRRGSDSSLPASLRLAISPPTLLLVFAAVYLMATTGLLGDLQGVQRGLVGGLAGWLASLTQASGRSPLFYVAVLVSYEQAALIFGVLGIITLRRSPFVAMLAFWAVAVLVLGALSQERPIGLAAQITIPLALIAGAYAGRLLESLRKPDARRGLPVFALGATVILAGLGIALSVFSKPDPPVTEALLAVPILLGAAALAYSVMANGVGRTLRHSLVVVLAVAVVWGWRENSMLSYGSGANPAQLLVDVATSPDVRQLASDVTLITHEVTIGQREAGVLLSPELPPTVSWYLRDTPNVIVGDTPKANTVVVVQPLDASGPAGYVGERYMLGSSAVLQFDSWKELWRWYAYREAPGAVPSRDAMVYVKPVG
jgi:uncharacterized protein (TIGR03663 family)